MHWVSNLDSAELAVTGWPNRMRVLSITCCIIAFRKIFEGQFPELYVLNIHTYSTLCEDQVWCFFCLCLFH